MRFHTVWRIRCNKGCYERGDSMRKNEYDKNEVYITELKTLIQREYGLSATSIVPAKRGYYGETWRVDTGGGRYFLKLDDSPEHQTKYRDSLAVVDYLCASGIDFVGTVVKTKAGELYSTFGSAVLAIFEWINGENHETDETKIPEYEMLCKVYAVSKPGFHIPQAVFSAEIASDFFSRWEQLKAQAANVEAQKVCLLLEQKSDLLRHYAERLQNFAKCCEKEQSNFYFTQGDAGGNLLVGEQAYYIPDWDEVMYAPPERDAWVMCCHQWAADLFNKTLRENKVDYELRPHRLAFYCYHMFFYYLVEFLKGFTKGGLQKEMEDYFDSWIMERMEYAETIS